MSAGSRSSNGTRCSPSNTKYFMTPRPFQSPPARTAPDTADAMIKAHNAHRQRENFLYLILVGMVESVPDRTLVEAAKKPRRNHVVNPRKPRRNPMPINNDMSAVTRSL